MLDSHAEVRGSSLEDLLEIIRERDIIEEEDGAGLEVVGVVESLVRDRPGETVLLRNLLEHGGAGVGLSLAGVARYRDMKAVCVLDRLRRDREGEALRDGAVADMGPVEGVEHERERVAGPEDLKSTLVVLVGRRGGVFHPGRHRSRRPGLRSGCRIPRRPGFRSRRFFLHRRRRPGSWCPVLRLLLPPGLMHRPEFGPPLGSPATARVVAAGVDGAVCKLDRKRAVLVRPRERALFEHIERPAVPGLCVPDGYAMVQEPGGEIDLPAPLLPPGRLLAGEEAGDGLQPVSRHNLHLLRRAEDLCPPVGALRREVALPRYRPVEFPDPAGVVVRCIDRDNVIREEGVEGRKNALHELCRGIVVREVYPIQEMRPVPGVRDQGLPEPLLCEVAGDPRCSIDRRRVLRLGRRDPARPDRVDIDREPAPADDIGIRGGGVLAREPHLDPVRPPGKECRVYGVQGHVDPGDRGVNIERLDRLSQPLIVIKISRVCRAIGERPDLNHAFAQDLGRAEDTRGPGSAASAAGDLIAHTLTSGIRGKSGAEIASPRATLWKLTNGTM